MTLRAAIFCLGFSSFALAMPPLCREWIAEYGNPEWMARASSVARRVMGTGRVSGDMLRSPKYQERFGALVEMAEWTESEEGKEVAVRFAELMNEAELAESRKLAELFDTLFARAREGFEKGERPDAADAGPTTAELETAMRQAQTSIVAEHVSPTALYERAAREIAERNPDRPTRFRPEFPGVFLAGLVPRGTAMLGPLAFEKLVTLSTITKPSADTDARVLAAITQVWKFAGGNRSFGLMEKRFEPLLAPHTRVRKGLSSLVGYLSNEGLRLMRDLVGRSLTAPDLEKKIDELIEAGIPVSVTNEYDRKQLHGAVLAYFRAYVGDVIPQPYARMTAAEILEWQQQTLAVQGRRAVEHFTQDRDKERKGKAVAAPAAGAAPAAVAPLTREQRIAQYAERKAAERLEALERSLLPHAERPEIAARPAEAPAAPTLEVAEAEMEKLFGTRTVTADRAVAILSFYDNLKPDEKTDFRRAVGQLLHGRRLSDVVDGTTERIKSAGGLPVYELRVQGKVLPIRVYFGIYPGEGVYLIDAHYKKDEATQERKLEKVVKAWKAFEP